MRRVNRRDLLRSAGLATAALPFRGIAAAAAGRVSANDKLTVACIGVGSQGLRVLLDLLRLPQVQIVAVCDVNRGGSDYLDWGSDELRKKVRTVLADPAWNSGATGPTAGREPAQQIVNAFYATDRNHPGYRGCTLYEDYRELLHKEKDLDAVVVSTPDHWHAIIAIAAMRAGKHVYSQKPMAHSVAEVRAMDSVARETGRATQVSIFNSNSAASQQVHDLLANGVIGPVRSIDIWTKRASAFWKQGLPTPVAADPVPAGLNWDMWLGPAKARPFNRAYLPFVWRAWYDFGCGALGDMGEYGFDTIYRVVGLQAAEHIAASTTDLLPECYPVASMVHFEYAKTDTRPAIEMNWYDGGIEPRRPAELADTAAMGTGGEGVIYTGDRGKLMTAFMGGNPRVLSGTSNGAVSEPDKAASSKHEPFQPERPELGGSASGADAAHYLEWVHACQGGPPARANYANQAPIVESLMLGCIAVRTREVLQWDAASATLTRGSDAAKVLLKPAYRAPWG